MGRAPPVAFPRPDGSSTFVFRAWRTTDLAEKATRVAAEYDLTIERQFVESRFLGMRKQITVTVTGQDRGLSDFYHVGMGGKREQSSSEEWF